MKGLVLLLILIAVIAVLLIVFNTMGTPEVEVERIAVTNLKITHMEADVGLLIQNPYPIGANIDKITFSMYYVGQGKERYLGSGEKEAFRINSGPTSVVIPVQVSNIGLLSALVEAATKGAITVKVNGTATIDLPFTSYEIPFEETQEINIY